MITCISLIATYTRENLLALQANALSPSAMKDGAPRAFWVDEPHTYKQLLAAAGFTVVSERARRTFALAFFEQMRARMAESGASPLGLPILMGANAGAKITNMITHIAAGRLAPVEIIARAS